MIQRRVTAIAAQQTGVSPIRLALGFSAFGIALALGAVTAKAQDADVIKAHGISTFGQLKYDADFTHLDYVNPDAPKGGEMSIWGFGSFDSVNPYTTKGRAVGLSTIYFESMLTGTADEIGASYCLLCESMEYPADRSWVIFNLRPEAKFSDGTPITAEDVIFSYETFLEKGLPSYRTVLAQQVEKAEIVGEGSVKFTFKADFPTRDLPQEVGGLPVFSKANFEANNIDLEESTLTPFLGSSPYLLDELEVGKRVIYRRNPDYWGENLPINKGRNNFDTLRVEYYADYNAAFEGFKAGNYMFRNEASSKNWATSYDFPSLEKGWVVKRELADGSKATGQSFVFNMRRPQFQDPKVREALGLMFNFEWSNETLFYGLYARVHSLWENSYLAAVDVPTDGEIALLQPLVDKGLLDASILTDTAVMAPSSGERQLDRKNLRAASALLDEAGWTVGDDGKRRNANGETLRVEFLNDSQTFDRVINPYVENLQKLGVDAYMTRVDNAQMTNRERSYDFDVITDQLPMDYVPGSGLKQYFGSETVDTSVFNKMGLKDPAVDELIKIVLDAETEDELITSVKALDRVLRSIRFWVPQWYKDAHTVAYFDMFEHPENMPPYSLGHLDFWWYNAEKAEKLKAAGAF